jgi:hypothetical protein
MNLKEVYQYAKTLNEKFFSKMIDRSTCSKSEYGKDFNEVVNLFKEFSKYFAFVVMDEIEDPLPSPEGYYTFNYKELIRQTKFITTFVDESKNIVFLPESKMNIDELYNLIIKGKLEDVLSILKTSSTDSDNFKTVIILQGLFIKIFLSPLGLIC